VDALADMDASQRMLRLADGPDGVHWFVVGRAELERWADRAREYDPKATLPGAAVAGSRVHRAVIPPCDRRVNAGKRSQRIDSCDVHVN